MRLDSWKILLPIAVALLAIPFAVACGDDDSDEPFRIGVMESATGPG